MNIEKYELSGGSLVEVHKVFGNDYYLAIVDIDGEYPETGKIAKNSGRQEYIIILEGSMKITVDGEEHSLVAGESILVPDGGTYGIIGKGRALVFVNDQPGSKTDILDK